MIGLIGIEARKDLHAEVGLPAGGDDIDHLEGNDQGGVKGEQPKDRDAGEHPQIKAFAQWRSRCPQISTVRPLERGEFSGQTVTLRLRAGLMEAGKERGRGERSQNRSIIYARRPRLEPYVCDV